MMCQCLLQYIELFLNLLLHFLTKLVTNFCKMWKSNEIKNGPGDSGIV